MIDLERAYLCANDHIGISPVQCDCGETNLVSLGKINLLGCWAQIEETAYSLSVHSLLTGEAVISVDVREPGIEMNPESWD